jgi:hypothetical protein
VPFVAVTFSTALSPGKIEFVVVILPPGAKTEFLSVSQVIFIPGSGVGVPVPYVISRGVLVEV